MAAYYHPGDQLIVSLDSLDGTGLKSRRVTIISRPAPGRFLVADAKGNQFTVRGADLLPNSAEARDYVGKLEKYVKLSHERDEVVRRAGRKITDDYEPILEPLRQATRAAGSAVRRRNPYRP